MKNSKNASSKWSVFFWVVTSVALGLAALMFNNVLFWGYDSIIKNNGWMNISPLMVIIADGAILLYIAYAIKATYKVEATGT